MKLKKPEKSLSNHAGINSIIDDIKSIKGTFIFH